MTFYLYDANTSDALQLTLQNPQGHLKGYKLTPPPMLEIFIVLNEKKDKEKCQGEGRTKSAKERRGGRGEEKHILFFRKRKVSKCLRCLSRSAYLRSLA